MTEFIVSILDDENDGDFSTDDLSLREAIALANDTEGADTITFDPSLNNGTITLIKDESTGIPRTTNLPLVITDSVNISGLGADNLTIDGDNGGRGVFEIGGEIGNEDPVIDVTVDGLTIANGAQTAFSFPGLSDPGGSFFVGDNANFTLQNSTITGSSASVGGAVYNRGTTNITNSIVENSSASGDGASPRPARTDGIVVNRNVLNVSDSEIRDNNGSGIFNIGTLEVENSSISNNTSIYAGGAIDNRNEATIVGSDISDNSAPSGSAIRNTDNLANRYGNSLTIDDTIIEGNTSTSSDNSVIVTEGTAFINNSTIANHNGGSNVGIVVESGTLNVQDSTISDNQADQAQSGIIINPEATANISNSTIASNEARSNAGIENFGTVNLNNNTIANNTGGLGGGGLRNFGNANITSNIVANNSGGGVGDISGDGTVNSGGNNLIVNANDVTDLQDSDLTDVDPQLDELQDNGGTTETISLSDDSVAIDAGSNPNNLETDQRGEGFDRTVGDATDIGAFEVQDTDNGGGNPEELVVSTLDDENDGDFSDGDLSLREAIAIANSEDTITFDPNLSNNTISITLGELVIDKDLTIQGLGANNLTIDGGSVLGESSDSIASRVFNIDDGDENSVRNVTIEGLTITGGNQESVNENGGGILNQENLTLKSSIIENNFLDRGDGGGIANYGSLLLDGSLVSNNSSGFRSTGGGILNAGTATVVNSTVIGNSSFNPGGGISNNGSLTVENSTITQNDSGFFGDGIAGSATITSSIVAGNQGTDLGISDIISGGNNLIGNAGDATGSSNGENGDFVGTTDAPIDPLLGDLQDNGGATPTVTLLNNSPAIDAGSNPNNLTNDQRGEGFDRTVGDGTDIGSFEVQDADNGGGGNEELVVSTLDDENDGDFSDGDLSLCEAIALANDTEGEDTITFDPSLSGGTIALTETEPDPRGLGTVNQNLLITDSVTISGLGANNLTIDGVSGGNGIFTVDGNFDDPTLDVVFEGLTITNGNLQQFFSQGGTSGGAIQLLNNIDFTLVDSVISNSSADAAGAISAGSNDVEIIGSLITNNVSGGGQLLGGAVTSFGDLTMINSTITNSTGIGLSSRGTLDISNSTITDGISANNQSTTVTSSIVVNNNTEDDDSIGLLSQNIISGGNNLISNTNNEAAFIDSDLVGTEDNPTDSLLGTLEDNGGNIPTVALLDGSPAIDAGSNPNNLTTDQRGEVFNRTVGDGTDIGAFEVQDTDNGGGEIPNELVVSTLDDENDGDFSDEDLSLREAIALASTSDGADTITFDDSLSGGTISLDESLSRDLIVSDSVTINGLGQDNLTLAGGFVFKLPGLDAELNINDLNLTGGTIDSFGDLTLTDITISQSTPLAESSSDNSSIISRGTLNLDGSSIIDSSGGDDLGILIESGTANISNSTIANHEGVLGGSGVLILTDETVNISNSTIANNNNRFAGGIANAGGAEVNISNSTIANNVGSLGNGGIQNSSGTVTLASTILTGNDGSASIGDIAGDGEYISGGNNLISNGDDADGFVNGENGDLVGSNGDDPFNPQTELLIDPNLGELQNNGGSTSTFALLEDSPAIDAGSNPNDLDTDQRGEGFDRTVGDGTDIGAFEVQDIQDINEPENPDPLVDNIFNGTNENDSFDGSTGNDLIFGQNGHDTLNGNDGNDTINGGAGDDILSGGHGNDLLDGDTGNDYLRGDGGDDILVGGDGHDTLLGGEGNDTLFGGHGDDTFVLGSSQHQDTIVDFTDGSDRLELLGDLSFDNLIIATNESNSGVSIVDSTNNDAVLALVENVDISNINAHDFVNI